MMKNMLLGLLLVALTACQTNDYEGDTLRDKRALKASIEEFNTTRTYMGEDFKFYWHIADEITVYTEDAAYNYYFTGATGDRLGYFYPQDSEMQGVSGRIVARYPSQWINEETTDTYDTFINEGQKLYIDTYNYYVESSELLSASCNYMVAEADVNGELKFKNAMGYLMIKLYGENVNVQRVEVSDNIPSKTRGFGGNYILKVLENGEPQLTPDVSEDSKIDDTSFLATDGDVMLGESADEATIFMFALPPATFTDGITLTVVTTDGRVFKKTTMKEVAIERNTILPLAPLEVVPVKEHDLVIDGDENLYFTADESNFTFGVRCWLHESEDGSLCLPVCDAEVIGDVDWLTMVSTTGTEFTYTAAPNLTGETRMAVIYVTERDGYGSNVVEVVQSAAVDALHSIVGTWRLIKSEEIWFYGGNSDHSVWLDDEANEEQITFRADGTAYGAYEETYDGEIYTGTWDFTYTYQDGILTIVETYEDGTTESYSCVVEDLTADSFAQFEYYDSSVHPITKSVTEYYKYGEYFVRVSE